MIRDINHLTKEIMKTFDTDTIQLKNSFGMKLFSFSYMKQLSKLKKVTSKKDSTFIAENYLDYKTDSLQLKKLLYTNKFKESFLNFRSKGIDFNGGGGFEIYYRKKDSVLALYVIHHP